VSDVIAKYGRCFGVGLRNSFAYRINFAFSFLAALSPVVIQTALWTNLYKPGSADLLFGFNYVQMIAYTVIANLVSRLVRTGFEYEMNTDIRTGGLDRFLVKPIGYFGFRMSVFLGAKAAQTVLTGMVLAAAVAVMTAFLGFPLHGAAVATFAGSILVALMLNFLIFWCVGCVGFWLTEIGFLFEAVRIIIITASGGIFPLSVFGDLGERILDALPFRFTIQFPTEILCGRIPVHEAASGFALAGAWIAALALLDRFLWNRGVRRFAAVGS